MKAVPFLIHVIPSYKIGAQKVDIYCLNVNFVR